MTCGAPSSKDWVDIFSLDITAPVSISQLHVTQSNPPDAMLLLIVLKDNALTKLLCTCSYFLFRIIHNDQMFLI